MNYLRRLFPIILLTALSGPLLAQQNQKSEKRTSFTVSADILQFFNDTYRIDLEGKKTNSSLSHFITAEFFHGNTNDKSDWIFNRGVDPVSGFGIGVHQKWISKKAGKKASPYVAYGLSIRNISIKYSDIGFTPYQQNSLEYYSYGNFDDQIKIKAGMANVLGGFQFTHPTSVVLDIYFGIAYKTSDSESKYQGFRDYNNSFSSFGYEGVAFQLGAKVGYKIL